MITDLEPVSFDPCESVIDNSGSSLPSVRNSSLRFFIPREDLDVFANDLNTRARRIVKRRLRAMAIIHRAKKKFPACVEIAATFHMERGWSAKSLHRLYLAFSESGDWRVLVDAAIAGPAWQNSLTPAGLPSAFLDWLAQQWAQKQRGKFRSVYANLLLQLDRWRHSDKSAAIPGYDEPPPPGNSPGNPDRPSGWEYSNLARQVKPRLSKFARKLISIGPKSASSLGPQLPGTRFGLSVGRYYILDDSWNDHKVIAYGQACRLLSFHVLDLFSACNTARGYKPALRDEKQVEERLKEKEMIWLLVKFLTSDGYHPSGTTVICEKATATIRDRERAVFADCGIPIIVQDGPAGGGSGIAGLYTGPGGGNPRWKAPLESWFNLLRNRTDDLLEFPGQTGSNARLNCPEGLPGLERDTMALLKAMRALPPEKAEMLRLGMLSLHESIFKLDAITEIACNCRTDHDLEAWRDCGHYVEEFRVNPQMRWLPTSALLDYDPSERTAIAAVLKNANTGLVRERALSPREVFDAGKSDLVKLPLSVAALLMADLQGSEETVKNCILSISCPEVDPDAPISFGMIRRDGRGTQTPLRNDEKFTIKVNPLDPRVAWLFSADGKFAGVAPYYGRQGRDDADKLKRAHSAKRAALAPLIEESRRAAANITRAETERLAHNAVVLGPTPAKAAALKQADDEFDSARASLRKAASTF